MSLTNTQIGLVILVVTVVGYLIYSSKCSEGFARRSGFSVGRRSTNITRPSKDQCKNIINNPIHPQYSYCKNELKKYCNSRLGKISDEKYCRNNRNKFN